MNYQGATVSENKAGSRSFVELFVCGKSVNSTFGIILNQILRRENSYDIVSSFSFENCSILHSQIVVNNEIMCNYEGVMEDPMYVTTPQEKKLIDQENSMINKEHHMLKKYKIFTKNDNKRAYKLSFSGFLFTENIKEMIEIFTHTQRNLKMRFTSEQSTVY